MNLWLRGNRRDSLAQAVARQREAGHFEKEFRDWLGEYNRLAQRSNELVWSISENLQRHQTQLVESSSKLATMAAWSEQRRTAPAPTDAPATDARLRLADLQKRRATLVSASQEVRTHADHLGQVEAFIVQRWARTHPQDCPTCGTNHAEQGGITPVVKRLRLKINAEQELLLTELQELDKQLESCQKEVAGLGLAQSPLSEELQTRLTEAVDWLLPEGGALEACYADKTALEHLNALIDLVQRPIGELPLIPADTEATRVAQALLLQFREAELIFENPDRWKAIRSELSEILAGVLRQHLPLTLAGLWSELAMNLTAAPWLLPDRPRIDVVNRRNGKKSTLRVRDRLARYILNQSEIHSLGLAWFFSRYLTHGRFLHPVLVLDDPAQEMDQTTYRELCRLLETWCRLHRIHGHPLRLVLLLNQENRALDIARATGATVHMLGWIAEQKNTVSRLQVVAPGFFAPQPSRLFEPAATPRAS